MGIGAFGRPATSKKSFMFDLLLDLAKGDVSPWGHWQTTGRGPVYIPVSKFLPLRGAVKTASATGAGAMTACGGRAGKGKNGFCCLFRQQDDVKGTSGNPEGLLPALVMPGTP